MCFIEIEVVTKAGFTVYVFILQCQILLKTTDTSVILIVFKDVLFQVCAYITVTVFYSLLYINQVPEKLY